VLLLGDDDKLSSIPIEITQSVIGNNNNNNINEKQKGSRKDAELEQISNIEKYLTDNYKPNHLPVVDENDPRPTRLKKQIETQTIKSKTSLVWNGSGFEPAIIEVPITTITQNPSKSSNTNNKSNTRKNKVLVWTEKGTFVDADFE
jgi:hypothetical protein